MNFRRSAFDVLQHWETTNRYASVLVDEICQRRELSSRDRSAVQRLVYAVIRNNRLLEHWAKSLAHRKLDPKTRRLVKMGLAELLLLEEAPHASVSETVQLGGWAKGPINGILRNAAREADTLRRDLAALSPDLRWSIPPFLWKRWVRQHGEEAALALCQWNHEPAPVYLRINPLVEVPASVRDSEELIPVPAHPSYFLFHGALPQEWLAQGWVYAQDPSTAGAIDLLDLEPGLRTLDACAAPGGKTFAIATKTGNDGALLATDLSAPRLEQMQGNLNRLQVQAEVRFCNWLEHSTVPQESFDRILLDAPCSNTGVIRRRIDVPHRLTREDFTTLTETQYALLKHVAPRLAKGGRLVYSVCSIDLEEGPELIGRFLQEHPDFEQADSVSTLPWIDEIDGTFAAALHRRG